MRESTVVIDARFRGPPTSANGGYTCGLLAALVPGAAEVTLRAPPPLGVPLQLLGRDDEIVTLRRDDALIAEARATSFELALPEAVTFEEASQAVSSFQGFREHLYPSCFVCGPERPARDGLGIFPGAVPGRRVAAAPWIPAADLCDSHGLVDARFIWAALDCPSWWGHAAFAEPGLPILLGRLSVVLQGRPHAGEHCVVLGWPIGRDGRRIFCGSALLDAAGRHLARAHATWIELKTPAAP